MGRAHHGRERYAAGGQGDRCLVRRFFENTLLVLIFPIHMVSMVAFAAYLAIVSPVQLKAQTKARWQLAEKLGITDGQVCRRSMAGGTLNTVQLDLVTIRSGDVEANTREIEAKLNVRGYTKHALHKRFPDKRWTVFVPPAGLGLPQVSFAVTAAGGFVDGTTIPVPASHCGARFYL